MTVDAAARMLESDLATNGWRKANSRNLMEINAIKQIYVKGRQSVQVFIARDKAWEDLTLIYLSRSG